MKHFVTCALTIILTSCAAHQPSEYEVWTSEATPESFKIGVPWVLILLDSEGQISRAMTIEFTSEVAATCSGGGWNKVKVLAEIPARDGEFLGEPSYFVSGAAITIDLVSNLCDAGYELTGKISETGVTGSHGPVSPWGGEIQGDFYAVIATGT